MATCLELVFFPSSGLWMDGDSSSMRSFCSIELIAFIKFRSSISSIDPENTSDSAACHAGKKQIQENPWLR